MAVSAWGQHYIQSTMPQEDPVMPGSLWADTSGTPVLKICTAISPYTFSTITGGGAGTGVVDRVVADGETFTIEDLHSLVVADYFAVQGSGVLEIEGDGVLAIL